MKRLSWFFIFRYLRGKGYFFNVNSRLSFAGVFVGTSLLVVVLSVFQGFQSQIIGSIFRFQPHLVAESTQGDGSIDLWREWTSLLRKNLGDKAKRVGGMIQSAGLLRKGRTIEHVMLRSIEFDRDPENNNRYLLPDDFPHIEKPEGLKSFPVGQYCFIGKEMAWLYNFEVGDTIDIVVPKGRYNATVGMTPSMGRFKIAGLFVTGHYEYDSRGIMLSLDTGQKLYQTGDRVMQLVVKLKDIDDLLFANKVLFDTLPFWMTVRTVKDEQKNLFAALQLEKTIQLVIVFLFIVAAMVGILVATYNAIRARRKDIGIMKAIGFSDNQVLLIFVSQGFIVGILATLTGIFFGIFLSLNLESILVGVETMINGVGAFFASLSDSPWYDKELIPKSIYYFDHLPVSIEIPFLHRLAVVSIFLSGLASLIPAWQTLKLTPIDVIRSADQ